MIKKICVNVTLILIFCVMKNYAYGTQDISKNLVFPIFTVEKNKILHEIGDKTDFENIPVFYVNNIKSAKILQKDLERLKVEEAFVISKRRSIIKNLVSKQNVHGVLDLREEETNIVSKTFESGAKIVLLKTAEKAGFLSKFNVTVWTCPESDKEFLNDVTCGAGGIICEDIKKAESLAAMFASPAVLGQLSLYGHRGSSVYAEENTISGVKKAETFGADYIEVDVRKTKDGEAVLMHDASTGRMCDENLVIKNTDLKKLKRLNINGEKIPTLKEFLSAFKKDENKVFNLEIKGGELSLINTAMSIAKSLDMQDRIYFSSFSEAVQQEVRLSEPETPCIALSHQIYENVSEIFKITKENNTIFSGVKNKELLRELRLRGMYQGRFINIDSEFEAFSGTAKEYLAYIKNLPHEIVIENETPVVLNRFGEQVNADINSVKTEDTIMYYCKVERADKPPYYIYSRPI